MVVLIAALIGTFVYPHTSRVARAGGAGDVGGHQQGAAVVPGEIIVKPKSGTDLSLSPARLEARKDLPVDVDVEETLPTGARVLQVDDPGRMGEVLEALRRSGDFVYVQPNYPTGPRSWRMIRSSPNSGPCTTSVRSSGDKQDFPMLTSTLRRPGM